MIAVSLDGTISEIIKDIGVTVHSDVGRVWPPVNRLSELRVVGLCVNRDSLGTVSVYENWLVILLEMVLDTEHRPTGVQGIEQIR